MLAITKKIKIFRKIEKDVNKNLLMREYNIDPPTNYDLKAERDEMLDFTDRMTVMVKLQVNGETLQILKKSSLTTCYMAAMCRYTEKQLRFRDTVWLAKQTTSRDKWEQLSSALF